MRKRRLGSAGIVAAAMALGAGAAGAVEADGLDQVPAPVDGEVLYIPWAADDGTMGITIDGDLADWSGVPSIVTTGGPMPSADPATNGELTWSVVAEGSKLYVSATITDASIIAGEHEDGYWNEDSIEVYLNATDNLDTSSYGPGIGQVRFSAVDIGNADPDALTLSGTNADTFDVEGLVFATPDGWGIEGVIDFSEWIEPTHGLSLGFQMHANGASTLDRDLKLIWSSADTEDVSFDDPSVFGTAVLFELGQTDVPTPAERTEPTATTTTQAADENEPGTEATTTAPEAEVTTTTNVDDAADTEDTGLIEGSDAGSTTTDDDSWTESSLLPIGLGILGVACLAAFALTRRRSPAEPHGTKATNDGPEDEVDPEEPPTPL